MVVKKKSRGSDDFSHKAIGVLLVVSFLVVGLIYASGFFGNNISGRVIFDLDANYAEGEELDGLLSLSMKKGEFLPASSKVVFEMEGQSYEYSLSEVIAEESAEGDFYVEGKTFSGSGTGYGVPGEIESFPEVSFILDIFVEEESSGSDSGSEEVVPGEEVTPEPVVEEAIDEVVVEEVVEEEIAAEEESAPESLPITGQVSLEFNTDVNGKASFDNPFSYNLEDGESAEIRLGSVKVGSDEVSENVLDLEIIGNEVVVTTSYSEIEEGFGENFLGEDISSLDINLSELGLAFGQGELKVSLVYGEEEIVSFLTSLEDGVVEGSASVDEGEVVEGDSVVLEDVVEEEIKQLSSSQIEVLREEFGNVSVKTTKSELVGDRLVVRYELGGYWIEYSYDYLDANLESDVESERIAWLSDLANALASDVVVAEDVEEFASNFNY